MHKCLTCGGEITKGQDEEMVTGQVIRYLHADREDCQAELRKPSPVADALRADRIRRYGGVVPKHGSLSQQEMHSGERKNE